MREDICTIPVSDVFIEKDGCPICRMYDMLQTRAVDYITGAAMMEPDYRIVSNEKGYCNRHYARLFEKPNKLSLALIMDTHLEEVRKEIDSLSADFESIDSQKKGIFRKNSDAPCDKISKKLSQITSSCVICDKVSHTMGRFTEVIFYLWEKEEEFRKKMLGSKGFCIPHFNALLQASFEHLNHKKACEFSKLIYELEKKELERIQTDIHNFTLKFDYRSRGTQWGTEIDAPIRTLEKLSGHIHQPKKQ